MPGRTTTPESVTPSPALSKRQGIWAPFRALGYISNDVPMVIQQRGQTFALTTCIGSSFQIYDGEKLGLLFVGPRMERPIACLAAHKDLTFAGMGPEIVIFERAKEVARLTPTDTETPGDVMQLTLIGDLILSLSSDNTVRIWNFLSQELVNFLSLSPDFVATHLIHPSTYVNKVLIAGQDGSLQLWNFRTMTLLYSFESLGSPVTASAQAPSVDILALGLADGTIMIHDIKSDTRLLTLKQEGGRVTDIGFRTDGGAHLMATGNSVGDVTLWDLSERRLFHVMRGVHEGSVHSVSFYTGQPILVTASGDNSLKMWLFDSLDGLPRLLKSRSGHAQPPLKLRFYGSDGRTLLSSGRDRSLRLFSLIRDAQNTELSQGSLAKKSKDLQVSIQSLKLPLISDFDASESRAKDWDSILTGHVSDNQARTWSMKRKALGTSSLVTTDFSAAKSVAVTACGHFGLLGSAQGGVDRFNLQSGLHRGSYKGHTKAITGIATDALNSLVITSSLDKTVKFFSFASGKCLETLDMGSCVSGLLIHRASGLLAVWTDNLLLQILDIETRKVIRVFSGHSARITDASFSPDGRWIVSGSVDGSLRTWDIPSSHLVDAFTVDHVPTSLTFSPTGDFLVTSHVGQVGLFVWANRSLYENVPLCNLSVVLDDESMARQSLPLVGGQEQNHDRPEETESSIPNQILIQNNVNPKNEETEWMSLNDSMISLSSLAKTQWQNLLSLDAIKKRNKPKEPPKAPEKAPFFLTSLPGVTPKFVQETTPSLSSSTVNQEMTTTTSSKILERETLKTATTKFSQLLSSCASTGEYDPFLTHAKTLSPAAMDFEIRSLSLENDLQELTWFLEALISRLTTKRDFELIQAYLAVFLKIYGDVIVNAGEEGSSVLERLRTLSELTGESWSTLEEQLQYCLCLIDFARL